MKKIDADVLEGKVIQFAAIRPYDLLDAIEYTPNHVLFAVKDTVVIISPNVIVEFIFMCICFVNFLK